MTKQSYEAPSGQKGLFAFWKAVADKLKKFGIYIFAIVCVSVLFLLNGTDMWAEVIVEYKHYAQGGGWAQSFGGYLTLFPIFIARVYYLLSLKSVIQWTDFSALMGYLYSLLCIIAIVNVTKHKLSSGKICIILIAALAMLANPTVSSLINITHLGFVPAVLHITICLFRKEPDEIGKIHRIVLIPLVLAAISKPSFFCLPFFLVLFLTRMYKRPLTWLAFAFSAVMSGYNLFAFSGILMGGTVAFNISGVIPFLKFIALVVQSIGSSVIFAVTYFFIDRPPESIIVLSYAVGVFIVGTILLKLIRERSLKSLTATAIIGSTCAATVFPYIQVNYDAAFETLSHHVAVQSFWIYKLQYQLSSTIIMTAVFLFCLEIVLSWSKAPTAVRVGATMLCVLFAVNGLLSGVYSGQWQNLKEVKGINYNSETVYAYPPLPDFSNSDSLYSSIWASGERYSKYLYMPDAVGGNFREKNPEAMPAGIEDGNILIMYSDPFAGKKSPTRYWDFIDDINAKQFTIGDFPLELSRATYNAMRYAYVKYTPELAQMLYDENYTIKEFGDIEEEINAPNLNFIISY
jgi:hypothetical protein